MDRDWDYVWVGGRQFKVVKETHLIEVQPPKAGHVQSVVRPQDVGSGGGESGRSPDRLTVAKVIDLVSGKRDIAFRLGRGDKYERGWRDCIQAILKDLKTWNRA